MRAISTIFRKMRPACPGRETQKMSRKKNKDDGADPKTKKSRSDPTKNAPFKVDPNSDDFATPRNDLSEEELKEQEDRRP
jgi:hypothetical protein